jgi:hypothetical protein
LQLRNVAMLGWAAIIVVLHCSTPSAFFIEMFILGLEEDILFDLLLPGQRGDCSLEIVLECKLGADIISLR